MARNTAVIGGFVAGASSPLRALALLRTQPGLWRYLLMPVLVNIVVFALLTVALFVPGLALIDRLLAGLPQSLAFVEWLLRLLLLLALLLINGFLLAQFGVALGAPWYSDLSARVEQLATGIAPPESRLTVLTVLRDIGRALAFQIGRLFLAVTAFLLLLPLNLVPGVGSAVATAGNALVGALLLSLDFLDPPLDRRRLAFGQKLAVVRANAGLALGLGFACLFLVSVPLLNLFTIPLCIVAGTLLYSEYLATG